MGLEATALREDSGWVLKAEGGTLLGVMAASGLSTPQWMTSNPCVYEQYLISRNYGGIKFGGNWGGGF